MFQLDHANGTFCPLPTSVSHGLHLYGKVSFLRKLSMLEADKVVIRTECLTLARAVFSW
jgi:hypothetical protein